METDLELRGRPPLVTIEQYQRIVEVRRARAAIPTDKELAQELGLNPGTVSNVLRRGIKTFDRFLSRRKKPCF